jgi:hypothetical protein
MLVVDGVTNLASPVLRTSDRAPAPNWAHAVSSSGDSASNRSSTEACCGSGM